MKLKKLGLLTLTAGTALALAACNDIPTDNPNPDDPSIDNPNENPSIDNPNENPSIDNPNENPGNETQDISDVQNIEYSAEGSTLSWDEATNATGYVININGTIYNSSVTSLKLEESFVNAHSGCYLEVKVYGYNSTKQGNYSAVEKILIGEDTATEEQLNEAIAAEAEFLDLQEVQSFLEQNQITKTEFISVLSGETGNVGKDKCAFITLYLAKNELDSGYAELVNPNYTEGQEKPLIQYIDDNSETVSKALGTLLSVKSLTDNTVVLDAISRFEDIKDGTLNFEELLNLYANIQLQLDEAVPTEEDIAVLISTAKDIIGIVAEENPVVGNRLYSVLFQEELTAGLTEEQLSELKAEINLLLNHVENILVSCTDLTRTIYSSISDTAIQEAVNLDQRIKENAKYLINERLEERFKTVYLGAILSKAVLEEFKSDELQNSLMAIVNELNAVTSDEVIANLLDVAGTVLPIELPETIGISDVVQELFGLITKDNIQNIIEMANLALEPWTEAGVIAAEVFIEDAELLYEELADEYISGQITEEEYFQRIEALELLTTDATFEQITTLYSSFRNVFSTVSEETLGLLASLIEEPALNALQAKFAESISEMQDELVSLRQTANESSYDDYIAMLEENIAYINEQLQELEANNSDGQLDSQKEELEAMLASFQEEKQMANNERELELAQKQEEITYFEQSLAEMQGYLEMINAFAVSEHDYTENYLNILKDIQGIVQNITVEDIKEIREIFTQEDLSDTDIITLLNYISKNDGDLLVKNIFDNIKIIASNEAIQAGEYLDEVAPILDMILEVSRFDATNELTSQELEKLNNLKEILFGLIGSME